MIRRRRQSANQHIFYDQTTDQMLPTITTPAPRFALPHESWMQRIFRGLGTFFRTIIHKVNQLLALALTVLLLLLFARFVLNFFHLSNSGGTAYFSHWVFFLSTPLVTPFENLLPSLPYDSYTIEVPVLIAILAYALATTIIRKFLKILLAW
jgi:uncharacterized protein YggT (Ycf19 family)